MYFLIRLQLQHYQKVIGNKWEYSFAFRVFCFRTTCIFLVANLLNAH